MSNIPFQINRVRAVVLIALLFGLSGMTGVYSNGAYSNETQIDTVDLQLVYLPLALRSSYLGEIRVLVDSSSMEPKHVHHGAVDLLSGSIQPGVLAQLSDKAFLLDGHSYVPLPVFAALGLEIELDRADAILIIRPLAGTELVQNISIQSQSFFRPEIILQSSRISAIANLDAVVEYRYFFDDDAANEVPVALTGDAGFTYVPDESPHVFNLYGRATYNSSEYMHSYYLDDARLRWDVPDYSLRMEVGTTILPAFSALTEQHVLGGLIVHDSDLQPYQVTRSLGRTSIHLDSPSRLRILVNDRVIQQLMLPAGEFDIDDIPMPAGQNRIRIEIIDEHERTETITLVSPHNTRLLRPGYSQYALGGGISRIDVSHRQAVGYLRHGFLRWLTMGFGASLTQEEAIASLETIIASPFGSLILDTAGYIEYGDGKRQVDGLLRFEYQLLFPADREYPRFTAGAQLQGARIRTPNPRDNFGNRDLFSVYSSISQSLSDSTALTGSVRSGLRREPAENSVTFSLTLGQYLEHRANLLIRGSVEVFEQRRPAAYLGITYSYTPGPSSRRPALMATHTLTEGPINLSASAPLYDSGSSRLSASASAQGLPTGDPLDSGYQPASGHAALQLYTPILESSLRGSYMRDSGFQPSRGSLSLRSAGGFVYADGAWSLTRPNRDAFVIAVPHERYRDIDVQLHTERGGGYTGVFPWGTGVISNMRSYAIHTLYPDAPFLPEGYDFGSDRYNIRPGFQQGTRIVIGSDATVMAFVGLTSSEGTPLTLVAGWVYDSDGGRERFFTNRDGTAELYGLTSGVYQLELFDGRSGSLVIPADAAGRIQVDAVHME